MLFNFILINILYATICMKKCLCLKDITQHNYVGTSKLYEYKYVRVYKDA